MVWLKVQVLVTTLIDGVAPVSCEKKLALVTTNTTGNVRSSL